MVMMMMMDADVYMSVTYIHKIYKSFCVSCSECCWIPSVVVVADNDSDDDDDDTHTSTHSSYCTDYLLVRSWFTSWCLRIDRRWVGLLSHHPHLTDRPIYNPCMYHHHHHLSTPPPHHLIITSHLINTGNPFDVLKTRMMATASLKPPSLGEAAAELYKSQGSYQWMNDWVCVCVCVGRGEREIEWMYMDWLQCW
jgi:hypothetical protein